MTDGILWSWKKGEINVRWRRRRRKNTIFKDNLSGKTLYLICLICSINGTLKISMIFLKVSLLRNLMLIKWELVLSKQIYSARIQWTRTKFWTLSFIKRGKKWKKEKKPQMFISLLTALIKKLCCCLFKKKGPCEPSYWVVLR